MAAVYPVVHCSIHCLGLGLSRVFKLLLCLPAPSHTVPDYLFRKRKGKALIIENTIIKGYLFERTENIMQLGVAVSDRIL